VQYTHKQVCTQQHAHKGGKSFAVDAALLDAACTQRGAMACLPSCALPALWESKMLHASLMFPGLSFHALLQIVCAQAKNQGR